MRIARRLPVVLSWFAVALLLVIAAPRSADAQCAAGDYSVSPCNPSVTPSPGATGLTETISFTLDPWRSFAPITGLTCVANGVVTGCSLSASSVSMITTTMSVTLTYSVSATPGSGSILVQGTTSDGLAIGTLFSVGPPPSYTVQVTPDGQDMPVDQGVINSVVFHVKNVGNSVASYALVPVCSGMVTSCGVSPTSVGLAPNQDTTVTLSFNTFTLGNPPSTTGSAGISATASGTYDEGSYAVRLHTYGVSVAAVSGGGIVPTSSPQVAHFNVTNSSDQALPFTLTPNCANAAFASCALASPGSPRTIGAGATVDVAVNYTSSATPGVTGNLTLSAGANSMTGSSSASVSVTTASYTVAVGPKGQSVTVDHNTSQKAVFTVTNNGNSSATYTIATACSGQGVQTGSCNLWSNALMLGSGQSLTDTLYYVAGAAGTSGTAGITATFGTVSDAANVTVNVNNVYGVVVTPVGSTSVAAQLSETRSADFYVKNTSSTAVVFTVSTDCSAGDAIASCTLTVPPSDGQPVPGIITTSINAGDSLFATIQYTTTANAGATGHVRLRAAGSSVTGTGDVTVQNAPPTYTADVTPPTGTVAVDRNTNQFLTFQVRNAGNAPASYTLTPICTGSITGCTALTVAIPPAQPSTTTDLLGPNQAVNVRVAYTAGAAGTSGTAGVVASFGAYADTGVYSVTVNHFYGVTVAAVGGPISKLPSTPGMASFNVTNTSDQQLPFTMATSCPGSAFASCSTPSPVTIAANTTTAVQVNYTTSATPAVTSRLKLTATYGTATSSDSIAVTTLTPTYTVAVTPDSQHVDVDRDMAVTAKLQVKNNGNASATYVIVPACSGAAVSNCVVSPTSLLLTAGQADSVTLTYHSGPGGAIGWAGVKASYSSASDSGYFDVLVNHFKAVTVTASASTASPMVSTPYDADFAVNNGSDLALPFTLTVNCSGTALVSCSILSPASPVTIGSGLTIPATIRYITSATVGATGTITLTATSGTTTHSASMTVTNQVANQLAMVADVTSANPGEQLARDLCFTVAAGKDAAYECGDLRLVHAFPTIRTKNKARTPVLLYTSQQAQPYALVAVDLTLPQASAAPTTVTADLALADGTHPATATWTGSQWMPGATRRVVLGFDATGYQSGAYPYTITLTSIFGSTPHTTTVSGTLLIVNRRSSPFGAGWWLAGLEQITPPVGSGDIFWVGGDGSARVYHASATANKWVAAAVDRPDTITFDGTTYSRLAEHGTRVLFNTIGQHVTTVNRLGDSTTFIYASGRLQSITVPQARKFGGPVGQYAFTYANPNATLSAVALTAGPSWNPLTRTTTVLNPSGAAITGFTDPDTSSIGLTYVGSAMRVQTRTDRRGHATTYSYDVAGKLTQVSVAMESAPAPATPTPPLTTTYRPLESLPLVSGNPIAPSKSYTQVDGPRGDVGDSTVFYLDRFGAPRTIINAAKDSTVLQRGDARFPALVTSLRRPNGFTTTATYDARGNVAQTIDVNPFGRNVNVTTSYKWDQRWDFVTRIDRSAGLPSDTILYDDRGNRSWQQTGPDASRRVSFLYDPATQLLLRVQTARQVLEGSPGDRIWYDGDAGNPQQVRSAKGTSILIYPDVFGNVTKTLTILDDAGFTARTDTTTFDLMDRPTLQMSSGPVDLGGNSGTEIVTVDTRYDREGNVIRVRRTTLPDPASIGTLEDSWAYDWANRQVKAIAVDNQADSSVYDPAGNVVKTLTRRGQTIAMTYDTLNRLTRRVSDSVVYQQTFDVSSTGGFTFPQNSNWTSGGLIIPADTAVFAYDAMGNMLRADNIAALVRRSYLPNGLVDGETQVIRTYSNTRTWGDTVTHRYQIGYVYDDAGRRKELHHPAAQATGSNGVTVYDYDPTMGYLQHITDPLGNVFGFHYDVDGRPVQTLFPGGVRDTTVYDFDSNVAEFTTLNAPIHTGSSFYPADTLYRAVLTRDPLGHVTAAATSGYLAAVPTSNMTYSGLGTLVRSTIYSPFLVHNQMTGENMPGLSSASDDISLDALGNQVSNSRTTSTDVSGSGGYEYHEFPTTTTATFTYTLGGSPQFTGRLLARQVLANSEDEAFDYDAAGNQSRDTHSYGSAGEVTRSYYDALNKLRVYNRQSRTINPSVTSSWGYDEYFYDALGRRVMTRSSVFCWDQDPNDGRCFSKIRRTIWDGSEELWEIQSPGDGSVGLESDFSSSKISRLWGRVLYVNGQGIDRPLGVVRFDYSDSGSTNEPRYVPGPFLTALHYSWRDGVAFPTYADGSGRMCAAGSTANCVQGGWAPMDGAYQGRKFSAAWPEWSWLGTVMDGKTDYATGLQYKRNRYYNPTTGRFTQEDPIGLAGGINAYGFAGGDPVTYSDPFGLCPTGQICPEEWMRDQARKALNVVGDFGNSLKAGLTAVGKEVALQAALLPLTGGEGNAIRITESGLAHVMERHTAEGALSAGKSIFAAGEDIPALVRSSEGVEAIKQGFGKNFQRIVNAGREIGIDRASGQPTSFYTVITNIKNELVTMFPGHP